MTQTTENSLRLERTYNAPIEKVRACLTDPALLARWFAPGDMRADAVSADGRVGGQYEIAMRGKDPQGNDATHTCTGTYRIVEPTRVEATFNWTEQPLPNETTLRFELESVKGGTKLVLIHEGLPGSEAVRMHAQGWTDCMEKLDTVV